MRTIPALLLLLALTAAKAAVASDPYADISAMRVAFFHVRSATAVERFSTGDVATVEYAWPNRYHITTPQAQIALTGNVEYTKKTGGKWTPSPYGAEHQALLLAIWQLAGPPNIDVRRMYRIRALGSKRIDGTLVRGYRLHDVDGSYDETVWIDKIDLPVAARITMPGQDVAIHYVGYNLSTTVAAH